jgi:UPF0271 protein
MEVEPEELTHLVLYQTGALKAFLDAEGMELSHLKVHGALYGRAARDGAVADAIAAAAAVFGVPVMGMAGTEHERAARDAGLEFLAEYYADLEYDDDGMLIITRKHVAYEPEKAVARVRRVLEEGVAETASGGEVPMRADCVCVHSDTPGAADLAAAVAEALQSHTTR